MNRIALSLTFALAAVAAHAPAARADEPPTKEQIEAAKKAFGEGKQLHDQGKLGPAVEKFKESYRLSRNPVLLYNIALTLDENKQADSALFYYRKFLSDAPADAGQRKAADERVKALENAKLEADLSGKPGEDHGSTTGNTGDAKSKIKPNGTYKVEDFQHEAIEDAPPGKPLDVTASAPEDAGWTLTLYYRASGSDYVAKTMKWHARQFIARIPASKVTGSAIQYYIEVKDSAGAVLTRSGKSTSPNLVNLDASAAQKYFPDFVDTSEGQAPKGEGAPPPPKHHEEEDPLNPGGGTTGPSGPSEQPGGGGSDQPAGDGLFDPGSTKFRDAKWGFTIGALALVAVGVTFDVMAGAQASALVSDSQATHGTCTALPCKFDSYDQGLQSAGQRDATISDVTIGVGVAAAVVAGYFWYRDLTSSHTEAKSGGAAAAPDQPTFVITPTFGQDFHGAAAAFRF